MKSEYFSNKIVEWYEEHHRDLPWRNTRDAYKIWLSEIILQQTRVAQGLPYYEKFILHYPDINSLAGAKEREVLRLWQGLGYYTRARNLLKCAREVVRNFKGKFPKTYADLKALPGIGDYTAAAIASFAFGEHVAVVDGNVYRVLGRIFGVDQNIASPDGKKFYFQLANELISKGAPGVHNQAVMEFGALHCLPQNPKCTECIFNRTCFAFQHDQQANLPVKIRQQKIRKRHFFYFFIRKGNKVLMSERAQQDIWKGLYDFPYMEAARASSPIKMLGKFLQTKKISGRTRVRMAISKQYKHILTHQVIFAHFIELNWPEGKALPDVNATWFSTSQIEKVPKPVLITRYLKDRSIS